MTSAMVRPHHQWQPIDDYLTWGLIAFLAITLLTGLIGALASHIQERRSEKHAALRRVLEKRRRSQK